MTTFLDNLHVVDPVFSFSTRREALDLQQPYFPPSTSLQQLADSSDCDLRPRSFHSSARPWTPLPEMHAVHLPANVGYFPQEHGFSYAEQVARQHPQQQPPHRVALAPVTNPQDVLYPASTAAAGVWSSPIRSNLYDQNETMKSRAHKRKISETHDQKQGIQYRAHKRQPSQMSVPATPQFQTTNAVNKLGENMHDLAARIACLFWFESSEVLQSVEDAVSFPPLPTRPLVPEARPTQEFRKWVTHVLSTTRVADNVILLALLFIYRLKKHTPNVRGKPGSEFRLLTVALMLGNKFLDDNTYTNKTWAEVSYINVSEVHVMEVEFLSNMKYNLSTSERDWQNWQSLLGRFATFYTQAMQPVRAAPVLPPAPSLQLPRALPSPPMSHNASPPYASVDLNMPPMRQVMPAALGHLSFTPAASPLDMPRNGGRTRKRSLDEIALEPAAKRLSTGYPSYISPQRQGTLAAHYSQVQPAPRIHLPSLSTNLQPTPATTLQPTSQVQQLPPLHMPARAMAMVYPSTNTAMPSLPAADGPSSVYANTSFTARNPPATYATSAVPSPTTSMPTSATALYPSTQVSPSYFLQQRSSPYRPVHRVSTLLCPPPSAAVQVRPGDFELHQMQYQPLGKPINHVGRLPYLATNQWIDGMQPHDMTPVHQWPGFANALLPAPSSGA